MSRAYLLCGCGLHWLSWAPRFGFMRCVTTFSRYPHSSIYCSFSWKRMLDLLNRSWRSLEFIFALFWEYTKRAGQALMILVYPRMSTYFYYSAFPRPFFKNSLHPFFHNDTSPQTRSSRYHIPPSPQIAPSIRCKTPGLLPS